MPSDVAARIVRHQAVNPDHLLLTLEAPSIARTARAGQFVMLQVREGDDPLLRRPMSLYRVHAGARGRIQILYKVVGEGTRCLSERPVGSRLSTIGPLGNGFRIPRPRPAGVGAPAPLVLVAGGIGIAIFPFLVDALARHRQRPTLLFGARSRRDLVALDFFRSHRVTVRTATEDGSSGTRGYVTRLLESLLDRRDDRSRPQIYACGPTPMLRAVAALANARGVPCQLALETHMPCGIGVCLGCVVLCRGDGPDPIYRRVCTEGPIFDAPAVTP